MTKEEVRSKIREKKRKLTKDDIISASESALQYLISLPEYKDADEIYTYISYNQEICTLEFVKKALFDGKKVAVPLVEGAEIEFYYITSLEELKPGYQGIPEPSTLNRAALKDKTLMLMPGLAFSKDGKRIGYGGGYYDRYLCRYKDCNIYRCGFAYEFQIYDDLKTEEYDQKIDVIVTPKNIYRCHKDNSVERRWNI